MSFRVTTGMSMNSYRYNLNKINTDLSESRNTVLTQRKFNSYCEDPAAATQAFRLRRSYWQTSSHLDNATDTYKKFNTAWTSLGTVVEDLTDKTGRASSLLGATGTAGDSRTALGQVLKQTAESVVQTMNVQYGDQFVFAGTDGLNVPFTWGANGTLLYRGIDVSSPNNNNNAGGGAGGAGAGAGGTGGAGTQNTTSNYELLVKMANETQYIDLGMGMKEANGTTIDGSAFNMALPGIQMLGYGVDEDGDPKNVVVLMYQLGDIFSRCDSEGGDFATQEDKETANRLIDKLKAAQENMTEQYVELDTRAQFLQTTTSRLTDQKTAINEQILEVEQVDLAEAITDFSWQQYCYNAALKVGNQLLSQSLIDYMN